MSSDQWSPRRRRRQPASPPTSPLDRYDLRDTPARRNAPARPHTGTRSVSGPLPRLPPPCSPPSPKPSSSSPASANPSSPSPHSSNSSPDPAPNPTDAVEAVEAIEANPSPPSRTSSKPSALVEAVLRKPSKPSHEHGTIYIVPAVHDGTALLKIGLTDQPVAHRLKAHEQACRAIAFDRAATTDISVRLHLRTVEKLAHAELNGRRHVFHDLSCRKDHQEYFAVDKATAERVVRRWVGLCEQKPWAARVEGMPLELKGRWRDWLEECKAEWAGQGVDGEEADLARWDRFVHPPWWTSGWWRTRMSVARLLWWCVVLLVYAVLGVVMLCHQGWLGTVATAIVLLTIVRLFQVGHMAAKQALPRSRTAMVVFRIVAAVVFVFKIVTALVPTPSERIRGDDEGGYRLPGAWRESHEGVVARLSRTLSRTLARTGSTRAMDPGDDKERLH